MVVRAIELNIMLSIMFKHAIYILFLILYGTSGWSWHVLAARSRNRPHHEEEPVLAFKSDKKAGEK